MKALIAWLVFVILWSIAFPASLAFQLPKSSVRNKRMVEPRLHVKTCSESRSERETPTHQCRLCSAKFPSRNALFRHVRSDPKCSLLANDGKPYKSQLTNQTRHNIALQFQYYQCIPESTETTRTEAEMAGNALRNAVETAIRRHVHDNLEHSADVDIEFKSTTQSSISKLRHSSLAQEYHCAATADVMVLSFLAPAAITSTDENEKDVNRQRHLLNNIIKTTNEILDANRDSCGLHVSLLACKLLSVDSRLHAERSCTQRIYHYLMPLSWLPGGTDLQQWWIYSEENDTLSPQDVANHHVSRVQTRPPNDSLLRLKNALRSAESDTTTNHTSGRDAAGRFGTLANKIKRPWHNFADPMLRGDASPNNEPVWRVVDRARLVELETRDNRVFAVLEFRGDDFLPQQVRRIVGTAVAMTYGWLPFNAFNLLTRSDVLIQAPLAPEGHLYLEGVRFHFDEMRLSGQGIFESDADGVVAKHSNETTATWEPLLTHLSDEAIQRNENAWLQQLRNDVAPRIREELDVVSQDSVPSYLEGMDKLEPPPACYDVVLELLRSIVASGDWPATSAARSNVIRSSNDDNRGSFTVVNPSVHNNALDADSLPLGNSLFPHLVEAVFDLELSLADRDLDLVDADGMVTSQSHRHRPLSSHCAINCNAEFTPHVDSGRGAGQSLSMIVGLGDYVGGELAVEGLSHDIRYKPLEFDGWKLRHWTLPFAGERFSLVWFTPEIKGKELRLRELL